MRTVGRIVLGAIFVIGFVLVVGSTAGAQQLGDPLLVEPYTDGETFTDCNGNGTWDASVNETSFVPPKDCNLDGDTTDTAAEEKYNDTNPANGAYDAPNGRYDFGEAYTDTNGNGAYNDTAPHGGYSSTSNMCRSCHAVHGAEGEYALMWQESVTATCNTCHALFGNGGDSPRDVSKGGGAGQKVGTASQRSAYLLGAGTTPARGSNGHKLGSAHPPIDGATVTMTQMKNRSVTRYDSQGALTTELAGNGTAGPFNADGNNECVDGTGNEVARNADGTCPTGSTDTPYGGPDDIPAQAGEPAGALYCGSCHSPHGDWGQMTNNWVPKKDANSDGDTADCTDNSSPADGDCTDTTDINDNPGDEGTAIYLGKSGGKKYLKYEGGIWKMCTTYPSTGCTSAVSTDTKGNSAYLYGYKLLSGNPNHSWEVGEPFEDVGYTDPVSGSVVGAGNGKFDWKDCLDNNADGDCKDYAAGDTPKNGRHDASETVREAFTDEDNDTGGDGRYDRYKTFKTGNHDTPRWCGTCHPTPAGGSGTHFHDNSSGCLSCHTVPDAGVAGTDPAYRDFPHSSQLPVLLRNYGDAICMNCHTAGTLP